MKKLATLFTDSWNEFHQVRTITTAAMFGAISVVLGYFTIAIGDYIKIGFSTICNQFVYYLFGPVVGGFFGGALDVLKFLIKPTGAFFPGFTIGAMIGGSGSRIYSKPGVQCSFGNPVAQYALRKRISGTFANADI